MTEQSVPGVTLPVPDALELKLNTAIAWWIDPSSRAAEFPAGQDFTLHYIDWVRVYDRVSLVDPVALVDPVNPGQSLRL